MEINRSVRNVEIKMMRSGRSGFWSPLHASTRTSQGLGDVTSQKVSPWKDRLSPQIKDNKKFLFQNQHFKMSTCADQCFWVVLWLFWLFGEQSNCVAIRPEWVQCEDLQESFVMLIRSTEQTLTGLPIDSVKLYSDDSGQIFLCCSSSLEWTPYKGDGSYIFISFFFKKIFFAQAFNL